MISYEHARKIVIQESRSCFLSQEEVSLSCAVGRVVAEPIVAPLSIQPFDNSAMDGYAVLCSDLSGASNAHPVFLKKAGVIAAGDCAVHDVLRSGTCLQIMTGAALPQGADAIIPVEQVTQKEGGIECSFCPSMGDHIRKAGADIAAGTQVIPAGHRITFSDILPLASLGVSSIKVFRKLRVVFLATGKELVSDLSQPLQMGQIYNSNLPYAKAVLETLGVDCVETITIPDDPAHLVGVLKQLRTSHLDMIISSGAVSAGSFDFVRESLEETGAEILFHKVKMKPGKPNLFARLPDGVLYFGLPGNPSATAAGLRFLVEPSIREIYRQKPECFLRVRAKSSYRKKAGLQLFLKAKLFLEQDGGFVVNFLEGQESFMVHPFLKMNCWAVLPEESEGVRAGDFVEVYFLNSDQTLALS
jgi:molybdopterin molybdotransferase